MRQPLDSLTWVEPSTLTANGYNPNHVPPRELALLRLSITESGWTQPIVATKEGIIIDGFHRWHLAVAHPSLTNRGKVPVVYVDQEHSGDVEVRLATIRHNRARGTHYVKQMAVIVTELIEADIHPDEIGHRLGMEPAEVTRLAEFGSVERLAGIQLRKGWIPNPGATG